MFFCCRVGVTVEVLTVLSTPGDLGKPGSSSGYAGRQTPLCRSSAARTLKGGAAQLFQRHLGGVDRRLHGLHIESV